MAKSAYSLVLSDDIIETIDSMAAGQGQSRSGLINQILADYAQLSTPEGRMQEVAQAARQALGQAALRSTLSAGGTLTFTRALRYKYNPSLRYVVELFDGRDELAELRVGLRSQSEDLLGYLAAFFELWIKLELAHLPEAPPVPAGQIDRRYRRILRSPAGELSRQEAGEAIAGYIARMDSCVRAFFANLDDAGEAIRNTEAAYLDGLYDDEALMI